MSRGAAAAKPGQGAVAMAFAPAVAIPAAAKAPEPNNAGWLWRRGECKLLSNRGMDQWNRGAVVKKFG
jgi:hypothetical protein